nr:hypothetical protein [Bacillus massiliglaciei]
MVEVTGNKIVLSEARKEDVEVLYFWKYEEKEQEAKKWNGPYITEEKLNEEEYQEQGKRKLFTKYPCFLSY